MAAYVGPRLTSVGTFTRLILTPLLFDGHIVMYRGSDLQTSVWLGTWELDLFIVLHCIALHCFTTEPFIAVFGTVHDNYDISDIHCVS